MRAGFAGPWLSQVSAKATCERLALRLGRSHQHAQGSNPCGPAINRSSNLRSGVTKVESLKRELLGYLVIARLKTGTAMAVMTIPNAIRIVSSVVMSGIVAPSTMTFLRASVA